MEVNPYYYPFPKLEPVDYDFDGVKELRGFQRIVGICNADMLSYLESVWKFEDSQWKMISLQYSTFLIKK